MALLTDQIFASGVSLNDLIHIVITGDTSQNPAGSSFKASIAQVAAVITGATGTSGSSGSSGLSGSSGTSGNAGTSGSSGTSGANGSSGSSGTSGANGTSGSSGSAGTSGTSPVSPYPYVYGLFSQIDNSNVVSGTTSETSIIGNGVGTLTVPANSFSVGDSFSVKMYGDLGASNGDNLRLKVKTGSVLLADTGAIPLKTVSNIPHFMFDINFVIRSTGTTGNAVITSSGFFSYFADASGSLEGSAFSTVNDTTFDTTISNTLSVTAQFDTTAVGTYIVTEYFNLNKIY